MSNAAKVQLLQSLELFGSLNGEELNTVAAHCRWSSCPRGEILFAGEGPQGRLYAVREGQVLISKHGDEHRDISLATFVAGEGFGELSLFELQADGTSARCESDSVLLVFPGDRSPADQFFEAHPAIGAKVLHNLLGVVARRIRSTNRLIAEKSPWVQELRRQVMLDKLTGLYNATFLDEDLPRMLEARTARVCLLMIKPDNFKTVNDAYGHQAGDQVLQLMSAELRVGLSEAGIPIRYRGDVLAAVLPTCEPQAARRAAEAVRSAMGTLALDEVAGGKPLRITVSVGVACCGPACRREAAALVELAYANLFVARNRGGDRICAACAGGAAIAPKTPRRRKAGK